MPWPSACRLRGWGHQRRQTRQELPEGHLYLLLALGEVVLRLGNFESTVDPTEGLVRSCYEVEAGLVRPRLHLLLEVGGKLG